MTDNILKSRGTFIVKVFWNIRSGISRRLGGEDRKEKVWPQMSNIFPHEKSKNITHRGHEEKRQMHATTVDESVRILIKKEWHTLVLLLFDDLKVKSTGWVVNSTFCHRVEFSFVRERKKRLERARGNRCKSQKKDKRVEFDISMKILDYRDFRSDWLINGHWSCSTCVCGVQLGQLRQL